MADWTGALNKRKDHKNLELVAIFMIFKFMGL